MITKLIKWTGVLAILLLVTSPALAAGTTAHTSLPAMGVSPKTASYTNPLPVQIPGDGLVESCADPSILRGQTPGDTNWYMYCTTDPLNGQDKTGTDFNFHLIPMLSSSDLVNWTYEGDAFSARPGWVADDAGMWAPEIQYFNGQYYLYYVASWTDLPGGGSAIGVATSSSPLGPWIDSGTPAVEPHGADCCGPDSRRWVFDPDVVEDNGQRYIFYGSYFGGISVRELSDDGLLSDPASQQNIAIANRYEGAEVVRHGDYWYLFASATDCCRGPLTGYSVFAGRSESVLGPYVDRDGASFMEGRVGGTPVLSMNGNRWVGTGHNAVFQDANGQWWTVYHAVDRNDPYFEGAVGFTKRPVLLDRLDWIDGWPTVRGGLWASDDAQPAPAAQAGTPTKHKVKSPPADQPAELIPSLSDEFNGALGSQWTWVREPAPEGYAITAESFDFHTQPADLFEDSDNASILSEAAPSENYIVETKVRLNLPPEGCCFNYVQAGLVVFGDDDNYVKLVHVSIWETRQTEFAKEMAPVPAGYPRYGNTVVSAPGEWTWLRIVKRTQQKGEELYTAYTSRDGVNWNRGGTWTHQLGSNARIGVVSMGGSGFTANFDYIRVYVLDD
ncbi:MAG TPA: family 43 glycosylhydrolase [Anaerolineales bacterium]|nr:family 43 glycosylhydrolase [Anaerolineales bacterium]